MNCKRLEFAKTFLLLIILVVIGGIVFNYTIINAQVREPLPSLKHSDVVFMGAKTPDQYLEYKVTYVTWGGGPKSEADITSFSEKVSEAHSAGAKYTAAVAHAGISSFIDNDPDFRDGMAVGLDGTLHIIHWRTTWRYKGFPNFLPCLNRPRTQNFYRQVTAWAMQASPDAFHMDEVDALSAVHGGGSLHEGCFCDYCMVKFSEYLKQYGTVDSLEAYGITDLDNFNYREFSRSHENYPLFDDFCAFGIWSVREAIKEYRKVIIKELGRDIPISANATYTTRWHTALAPELDFLSSHPNMFASSGLDPGPLIDYKIGEALHRPNAALPLGGDMSYIRDHDAHGLYKGWIAQSYAFGSNFIIPIKQWAGFQQPDYIGPKEEYIPVAHFIRNNAQFFDDYEPVTKVGLVYSFTDYRMRYYEELMKAKPQRKNVGLVWTPARYICNDLASANIPFGIALAGEKNRLEAKLTPEILSQFDIIVIPDTLTLDAEQQQSLDNWASRNPLIVWNGISDFKPRIPAYIKVIGEQKIWVVPREIPNRHDKPVVLHLLNRNYRLDQNYYYHIDSFTIEIDRSLFGDRTFTKAIMGQYNSDWRSLGFEVKNNVYRIHIPSLDMWGLVVLYSDEIKLEGNLPADYSLAQNYPNPFNIQTTIQYRIPSENCVELKIFNISGQEVKSLVNESKSKGFYAATWEGTNMTGMKVGSGLYFYRIETKDFTDTKKLVLLK